MFAVIRSGGPSRPVRGIVAAALTLAVCGGTTAAVTPQARTGDTSVTVTASEFSLTLSRKDFSPGAYTFELKNVGAAPHGLSIRGPGVDATSDVIPGGKTTGLTVVLRKGRYELWCPVDDHRARGMMTTISVK
ncbi:hypothetical protein ACQPYK_15370 [Streptosporangium sp. CA-135522]|uniref:hypothetical protein n=1 Tax=Streptosporangium sp. CA-135522 TaxID=3240072 RepID=UPI003D9248EB